MAKDTVISAPDLTPSVTPDHPTPIASTSATPSPASLEPMTKRYAESTAPDIGSIAVLPTDKDSDKDDAKDPVTVEKAAKKAAEKAPDAR